MFRCTAAAAFCVLLPWSGAHGQTFGPGSGVMRIGFSPHVAYSLVARRVEDRVIEAGGVLQPYRADFDLGQGFGAGVHIEVPVVAPLTVFAAGGFLYREASLEYSEIEGGTRTEAGSNFAVMRGGFGLRFQQEPGLQLRRLSASLYGGPAFIREMPRPDTFRTHAQAMNLFGTHVGLQAELPVARRLSFSAGLENNFVWWQDDELGRRNDAVYESIGVLTTTTVTSRPTPLWTIRAGFTLQP
jgi:hypothetical protein